MVGGFFLPGGAVIAAPQLVPRYRVFALYRVITGHRTMAGQATTPTLATPIKPPEFSSFPSRSHALSSFPLLFPSLVFSSSFSFLPSSESYLILCVCVLLLHGALCTTRPLYKYDTCPFAYWLNSSRIPRDLPRLLTRVFVSLFVSCPLYLFLLFPRFDSWPFTMGLIGNVLYYSFHPSELRNIMQWLVWP